MAVLLAILGKVKDGIDWLARADALSWLDPYEGKWKDELYGHVFRGALSTVAHLPSWIVPTLIVIAIISAALWCCENDWRPWLSRFRHAWAIAGIGTSPEMIAASNAPREGLTPSITTSPAADLGSGYLELMSKVESFITRRDVEDPKRIKGTAAAMFPSVLFGRDDTYDQATVSLYMKQFHPGVKEMHGRLLAYAAAFGRDPLPLSDSVISAGPKTKADIERIKRYFSYLYFGSAP